MSPLCTVRSSWLFHYCLISDSTIDFSGGQPFNTSPFNRSVSFPSGVRECGINAPLPESCLCHLQIDVFQKKKERKERKNLDDLRTVTFLVSKTGRRQVLWTAVDVCSSWPISTNQEVCESWELRRHCRSRPHRSHIPTGSQTQLNIEEKLAALAPVLRCKEASWCASLILIRLSLSDHW